MDSAYYYRQLATLERESADIQKKIADESKRELDKHKEIDSLTRSITSTTSVSTVQSKQSQILSKQGDLVNIRSKMADFQKKLADKAVAINNARQSAIKEEQNERKKQQDADKRLREQQTRLQQQESDRVKREQATNQRNLQSSLDEQKRLLDQLVEENYAPTFRNADAGMTSNKKYDLFISHASEDKEEFVKPLAEKLVEAGVEVWYDEYTLKFGDSLRREIDAGLRDSKFGLVVLSPNFFKKNWTQHELDGLVAREMTGRKVILPIWHRLTKDEVIAQSPTLADKVALNSSVHSFDDIVNEIKNLLGAEE